MKLFFKFALVLVAMGVVLQSCEEEFATPSVTLDNTEVSAKAGEEITIVATVTAPGGFSKLTIQKYWNDTEEGDPTEVTTLTDGKYSFMYTVTEDDVEPILKFRFTALDNGGQASSPVESVIDVELTKAQLLVKYDWAILDAVREKTGESDISDHEADNVYRFHEDGTYEKSYGTVYGDFDFLARYCYWDVNEETGRLILTATSFNWSTWVYDVDARDTLNIQSISDMAMEAETILRGLDAFNDGTQEVPYEAAEVYTYKYTAENKGSNFDPYKEGPEDDAGPTEEACIEF